MDGGFLAPVCEQEAGGAFDAASSSPDPSAASTPDSLLFDWLSDPLRDCLDEDVALLPPSDVGPCVPPPPGEASACRDVDNAWTHVFVVAPKLAAFARRHPSSVRHPRLCWRTWGAPATATLDVAEEDRWCTLALAHAITAARAFHKQRRAEVMAQPEFMLVCRRWWVRLAGEVPRAGTMWTGRLGKLAYCYNEARLHVELSGSGDMLVGIEAFERDFVQDCRVTIQMEGAGSAPGVSFNAFCSSLFEVVDTWTSSLAVEEYTALAADLAARIFGRAEMYSHDSSFAALEKVVVLSEDAQQRKMVQWMQRRDAKKLQRGALLQQTSTATRALAFSYQSNKRVAAARANAAATTSPGSDSMPFLVTPNLHGRPAKLASAPKPLLASPFSPPPHLRERCRSGRRRSCRRSLTLSSSEPQFRFGKPTAAAAMPLPHDQERPSTPVGAAAHRRRSQLRRGSSMFRAPPAEAAGDAALDLRGASTTSLLAASTAAAAAAFAAKPADCAPPQMQSGAGAQCRSGSGDGGKAGAGRLKGAWRPPPHRIRSGDAAPPPAQRPPLPPCAGFDDGLLQVGPPQHGDATGHELALLPPLPPGDPGGAGGAERPRSAAPTPMYLRLLRLRESEPLAPFSCLSGTPLMTGTAVSFQTLDDLC